MTGFTDSKGDKLAITINVSQSFFEGSGASWATSVPQDATLDETVDQIDCDVFRRSSRGRCGCGCGCRQLGGELRRRNGIELVRKFLVSGGGCRGGLRSGFFSRLCDAKRRSSY